MKNKSTILDEASDYIFNLFKEKLSPRYLYHNYTHALEIVEMSKKIGEESDLNKEELEVLELAAWFHDSGYCISYDGHEEKSVEIAKKFLNAHHYPKDKIQKVSNLILSTKVNHKPKGLIEEVLHDADYINIGKKSFFSKAELLRIEWEEFLDKRYSDADWTQLQLDFLLNKTFLTEYAMKEYGEQRKKNVEEQRMSLAKAVKEEDKKEEKKKDELPTRGVETMYRTTYRNHINLSSIADQKANMMISINAIIMSVIITVVGSGITFSGSGQFNHIRFALPICILLLSSLTAVIFAVLSANPTVTNKREEDTTKKHKRSSILFFGNFANLELDEFIAEMNSLMGNKGVLYNNMTTDIYYLGKVLTRKYKLLRISYTVFMLGLIFCVLSFMIVMFSTYEK